MIYVVCEQDVQFRQVFKAVELMGYPDSAGKLERITFAKASRRSSHLGDAQLLGDILDHREDFMHQVMSASLSEYHMEGGNAVAKAIGISSVVVQELCSRKGHSNNPDLSLLALEGGDRVRPVTLLCKTMGRNCEYWGEPDAAGDSQRRLLAVMGTSVV
jgi:arginyl-tRNA synthetase